MSEPRARRSSFAPATHADIERALAEGRIGDYVLRGELGRGATAVVYEVERVGGGAPLALKKLHEQVDVSALKREFRLARHLAHPSLVKLHELHDDTFGVYFTMDLVHGVDLMRYADDPTLGTDALRACFRELATAIAHLHAAAVVHGDLKPGNVLVRVDGRPVVVDFGLAHRTDLGARTGLSGTLPYVAPERFRGAPASAGSDWFAFGVMLYRALSGSLPFGADPRATVHAWASGRRCPGPARVRPGGSDLASLALHLLEPDPADRPSAEDALEALGARVRRTSAPTMVGRDEEVRFLTERIARGCRVIAIEGDPGVGKSRLARAALQRTSTSPFVVASTCHPREHVPFNALDGWIAQLLDDAAFEGRRETSYAAARTRLAAHVEGVRGTQAPTSLEGLDAALLAMARAQAGDRPVVLLLDDAQWADEDSVRMIEGLRADERVAFTLLVLSRPVEVRPAALVAPAGDSLVLGRLAGQDLAAIASALDPSLTPATIQRLVAEADGLPVALERHVRRLGSPDDAGVRVEDPMLVAALAAHARALDVEVLAALDPESVLGALDLQDAGIVEFVRTEARFSVQLRHATLGDEALGRLDATARAALHRRLAWAFDLAVPADVESRYAHRAAAGDHGVARELAVESARKAREALAFRRAADRLRYAIAHGHPDSSALRLELAECLAAAGFATEAGEAYLALSRTAGEDAQRLELAAADQLLRAGDVTRGRALLDRCLSHRGVAIPPSLPGRLAVLGRERLRSTRALGGPLAPRRPREDERERLELCWSAGLGLNMVDFLASAVAQARFTALALEEGDADHLTRALAVEYSYRMNAGGPAADAHGERLCALLADLDDGSLTTETCAMRALSLGAGAYFRGDVRRARALVAEARAGFERVLGPTSWEVANCGMYELWCAGALGELDETRVRARELLLLGDQRGDRLYRSCFFGGYSADAWLVGDATDELEDLLVELRRQGESSTIALFLELVARVRLDRYEGDAERAFARLAAGLPRLAAAGIVTTGWFAFVLLAELAATSATLSGARAALARAYALRRLRGLGHPVASALAQAIPAASDARVSPDARGADLIRAADMLEAAGHTFTALGIRQRAAELGDFPRPSWPSSVRNARALANTAAWVPA